MKPCRLLHCAIVLSANLSVFAAPTEAKECPGPNKVPHKDGTYDFMYESWVKKHPSRDHFDFGRCVQNHLADRSMFVDWKTTQVKGFARAKDLVDAGVESTTKDFDLIDTTLWYGSAPTSIKAPFREIKQQQQPQQATVRSWARMSVPTDARNAEKTLVPMDFEFISDVAVLANGRFIYRYMWQDNLAGTRKPINFVSQSVTIVRARKLLEMPDRIALKSTSTGSFIVDVAGPAYAVVLIEFLDEFNKAVGSAPVAIYYPSGSQP